MLNNHLIFQAAVISKYRVQKVLLYTLYLEKIDFKNRHNKRPVSLAMFIAIMESAMEHPVVSASFVLIHPSP